MILRQPTSICSGPEGCGVAVTNSCPGDQCGTTALAVQRQCRMAVPPTIFAFFLKLPFCNADGSWWLLDDSHVEAVKWPEVQKDGAYLLFYVRDSQRGLAPPPTSPRCSPGTPTGLTPGPKRSWDSHEAGRQTPPSPKRVRTHDEAAKQHGSAHSHGSALITANGACSLTTSAPAAANKPASAAQGENGHMSGLAALQGYASAAENGHALSPEPSVPGILEDAHVPSKAVAALQTDVAGSSNAAGAAQLARRSCSPIKNGTQARALAPGQQQQPCSTMPAASPSSLHRPSLQQHQAPSTGPLSFNIGPARRVRLSHLGRMDMESPPSKNPPPPLPTHPRPYQNPGGLLHHNTMPLAPRRELPLPRRQVSPMQQRPTGSQHLSSSQLNRPRGVAQSSYGARIHLSQQLAPSRRRNW